MITFSEIKKTSFDYVMNEYKDGVFICRRSSISKNVLIEYRDSILSKQ